MNVACRRGFSGMALTARIGLLALWGAVAAAGAEPPLALHPENPHYFLWRGEDVVLITSGEHFGAVLNLDFDYVRYLDELQRNKLNHTRTFSGVYREIASSPGLAGNTLAPQPERYLCPWARSGTPAYADGGNKFDLSQWDPAYFARLHDFLVQAGKRGIVVELNLFCPLGNDEVWAMCPLHPRNNVNGTPDCPREEVFTLKHSTLLNFQLAMTRKLVQELQPYDNLYYEICNEPYAGGVTMEWQHRIIDEIVAVERDCEHRHLIALNIANGRAQVEQPHPGVSIFNFHSCVPPDTVALNYGLNKAIGDNGTGFRGQNDALGRTEGWDFLIAGGARFNNLDYSFTVQHPDGALVDDQSPGGGSPELRGQLSILRDFLCECRPLVALEPDQAVIVRPPAGLQVRAMVAPDRLYAIYLHDALPDNPPAERLQKTWETSLVLQLPRGRYQAHWVNTKTGAVDKSETFDHEGGEKELASPPFVVDVALRVVRH